MERKKVKQNLPSFPISGKWQSRSKFRPGHRIFHIALFFRKFHKVKFEICNKVKISIFRNQFKEILDRKGGQTWDPGRKFSLLTWKLMTFTVHYRLRAIRGGPLGVFNFTSHFIVIQIFQILFLPPVSFYSHPNISDRFVGDEINLFNLTFHDITIY